MKGVFVGFYVVYGNVGLFDNLKFVEFFNKFYWMVWFGYYWVFRFVNCDIYLWMIVCGIVKNGVDIFYGV